MDDQPLWPVPRELEELIEVDQAGVLEQRDQLLEMILREERPDLDHGAFDAELIRGQVEPAVEIGAGQTAPLPRAAPN